MSRYYRSYGPPARTDQGRNRQQQHPQYSNSYPAEYADCYQSRRYQSVDMRNPGFVLGDLDEPNSDEEGAMLAERQRERQQREQQQREQQQREQQQRQQQQREHNNRSSERPCERYGSDRHHDSHSGGRRYDDRNSRHPPRPSARDDSRDSHGQGRNRDSGWSGEKEFWRRS